MGTKLGLTFLPIALLAGACGESRLDAFHANVGTAKVSDAGPSPPLPRAAYGACTEGATLPIGTNSLKLEVCADDIIHVLYAPGPSIPSRKSLVVVAGAPAAPPFQKTDTGDTIVLTTA